MCVCVCVRIFGPSLIPPLAIKPDPLCDSVSHLLSFFVTTSLARKLGGRKRRWLQ